VHKNKFISYFILCLLLINIMLPISVTYAAPTPLDNIVSTLATNTMNTSNTGASSGIFQQLFDLVFNKILGPVFNIFSGSKTSNPATIDPSNVKPFPSPNNNNDALKDKVIVVDPGHGGSNPGAVGNNTRESDNNLAVALKLRDKLVQAGAKVIMTRDTDRTVAPEGNSLEDELEARVTIAEKNHADIFISIHSNENSDSSVKGATTFYQNGKSSTLASEVENALVAETGATNQGTSPENFHVLRTSSMPSTLVEMGFVSNQEEAAQLNNDSYRNKLAQGIFTGIVNYFNNN
jgi:N-acetylmuramoyl-L-alanine amidase